MNMHVLPHRAGFSWSEEMDDALRKALAEGATFSEAATAIQEATGAVVTRNACIGRAARIGARSMRTQGVVVTKRPRTDPRIHKKKEFSFKPLTVKKSHPNPYGKTVANLMAGEKKIGPLAVDLPPAKPGPNAVTILEASACHCRWPYGDPRDLDAFRYCGEVAIGSSYCPGHQRQSMPARNRT